MARVVVADDHPIFLHGLKELLRGHGFDVVAEAADGAQLLEMLRAHKPDIAIVDVDMPVLDGLSVLRQARDERLACRFVVLSLHDERATVKAALSLGASAYVSKSTPPETLVACARAIAAGEPWMHAPGDDTHTRHDDVVQAGLERLTKAELRIVALLADNLTSPQIADKLGLSVRTVQNHRAHVCEKLMLSGANRLLQVALENKERILAIIRADDAV